MGKCHYTFKQTVVTFLLEFKAVDILTGAITKSKAPRATVSRTIIMCIYILITSQVSTLFVKYHNYGPVTNIYQRVKEIA